MNQPSIFQAQYPLSPRKFWKKIFGAIFSRAIFVYLIVAVFFLISYYNSSSNLNDIGGLQTIAIAILGLIVVFLLLYPFYVKTYIKRYYYDCGDQFITIKKGVFAPTEIHVQYQKIQDVYVDQDILDRMMGLYDVHIASATVTSGIEAHIDGVNAEVAENLKNIILAKIHGASNVSNQPQVSSSTPQKPQSNVAQFNQKISSDTYPISKKWVWSSFISAIFFSIFIVIFLAIFFIRIIVDSSNINYAIFPLLLLLFLVIFFIKIVVTFVWKKNYYFEFLPDYVLLRTGVFSRQENHLPYKSIQNILNKQSVLDRILGLGTVVIQNAAQQMVQSSRGRGTVVESGISIVWQPKEKAEELNNILNGIVNKINPQNSSNMMGL